MIGLDHIPRLRPHFAWRLLDEAHVLLISERTSVLLTGVEYVRLIPALGDGKRTLELVQGLADEVPAERLFYALECLQQKNLLTDAAPGQGDEIFWSQVAGSSVDEAKKRLGARKVSVSATGIDSAYARELEELLGETGVQCVANGADADIHIVLVNDYLNPALAKLNREFVESEAEWVIVRPVGEVVWFGPVFGPGRPCWECLSGRLQENVYGQYSMNMDEQGAGAPLAEFEPACKGALGLLANAFARWLGAGERPVFDHDLVSLDLKILETAHHHVFHDPGCGTCPPEKTDASSTGMAIDIRNLAAEDRRDAGYRVCSAEETMKRLQPLVSPLTGIVPRLEKAESMHTSHVYYARHTFRSPIGLSENRWIGKPSWACGKGASDVQARVSCVAEAVERYSCGYFGVEPTIHARMDTLDHVCSPADILNFSEAQYQNREQWNAQNGGFNWIPERFDPEQEIDWCAVSSLSDQTQYHVPAALCYLNYPLPEDHQFARADANGCASGNTIEEAVLQGMFELVERDSVAIWWYNRISRKAVDLESFGIDYFAGVKQELAGKGRVLQVMDITTGLGIYTFAAVSWREDGSRIFVGFGSHLDPAIAISRSLNEVTQLTAYHDQDNAVSDAHFGRWLQSSTTSTEPYVVACEGSPAVASDYPNRLSGHLADDIDLCVGLLGKADLNVLAIDMTRSNVGFPTARIIVPGLRHFWARFAPGRLFEEPVRMGLLAAPSHEQDMNPIPFPL